MNQATATPVILLDLKKTFELNLEKAGILNVPILQARAAIDKSGSMEELFLSGWVDNTLDLFIGAALKFDDNGELEVGWFDNDFHQTPVATENDAGTYHAKKAKNIRAEGGTCYAPIIENFDNGHLAAAAAADAASHPAPKAEKKGWFSRALDTVLPISKTSDVQLSAPSNGIQLATPLQEGLRAYVGIISDGANSDTQDFERILKSTDGKTFFQFILIGQGVHPKYLEDLSAKYKFLDVVHIKDPTSITPDSFYESLCNKKFAAWI